MFFPKADEDLVGPGAFVNAAASPASPASPPSFADLVALSRSRLGDPAVAARPLGSQGTTHRLLGVTLESGRSVVFRTTSAPRTIPDYALEIDAWVADRLGESATGCCTVYAVDTSRTEWPAEFEFLSVAEGRALTEHDEDEPFMRRALGSLAAYMAALHRVSGGGAGPLDVRSLSPDEQTPHGVFSGWSDYLSVRLDEHIDACLGMSAIDSREADEIREVFRTRLPADLSFAPVLLHGDPGNHNVFVTDDAHVTCMIDWEDALVGDPLYDVAFWATFHPERRWDAFFEGYEPDPRGDRGAQERFWLYFLRVSLMKTVLRHRLGYTDAPGRPPASDRIRRGLQGLAARA